MDIEASLRPYIEEVNARLDHLLPSEAEEPSLLHQAMRYSALAPGKRIRPVLTLICAEATGGSIAQALDAACAAIRFATFAHAISNTNATKTPSAARARRYSFCNPDAPAAADFNTNF